MSLIATPNGVGNLQVVDQAIAYLDMEQNLFRPDSSSGAWLKGKDGYVLLTLTSISWSSAYGSFNPVTDRVFLDFEIAGFHPERMDHVRDSSGVALENYPITTASGSITPLAPKYVWPVYQGHPEGVRLGRDGSMPLFGLRARINRKNDVPGNQPLIFTVNYTAVFTDLGSTISGATLSSTATCNVGVGKDKDYASIEQSAITGTGYVLLVLGELDMTSAPPARGLNFEPNVGKRPPACGLITASNLPRWRQYVDRHALNKVFNTRPFVLYPVNQGKIGRHGRNTVGGYKLGELRMGRYGSDDVASVTAKYSQTAVTL